MKKYFLLAIISIFALNTQAQIVNERNKERIKQTIKEGIEDVKEAIRQNNNSDDNHEVWDTHVMPKAGLNISNLPGVKGNMQLGLVLGTSVEVFLARNLAMDVELEYTHQGTGGVYTGAGAGPYSYNLDYLNTSYFVRWYPWRFSRWSVYTGLKMSQLLGANAKLKGGGKTDIGDRMRKGDFFIPLGVSYEWRKWQLDMRYSLSMLRLKTGDPNLEPSLGAGRNSMFQMMIAYRIQVF